MNSLLVTDHSSLSSGLIVGKGGEEEIEMCPSLLSQISF